MREPSKSLVFKHMGHSSLIHTWEAFTLDLHSNDFCCDFDAWFAFVGCPNSLIFIYAGHSTLSFIHVRHFHFKHLSYSYIGIFASKVSRIHTCGSFDSLIHICETFTSKNSLTFIHVRCLLQISQIHTCGWFDFLSFIQVRHLLQSNRSPLVTWPLSFVFEKKRTFSVSKVPWLLTTPGFCGGPKSRITCSES